jgi:CheY-like chemotaxis protein
MARILVVDDDDTIRVMLGHVLEAHGHSVALAADGDAGWQAYLADPADVVVTDLLMPGKDGLALIAELKRAFPEARIIAMSGSRSHYDLDVLEAALKLGAAHGLSKPFEMADMLSAVEALLAAGLMAQPAELPAPRPEREIQG